MTDDRPITVAEGRLLLELILLLRAETSSFEDYFAAREFQRTVFALQASLDR